MFIKPTLPPYEPIAWAKKPFAEKTRLVCAAWALQGYGSPLAVYLFYLLKLCLYVGGWAFFCSFTPGLGTLAELPSWWWRPEAFAKAILFSMLFESVGLGCGSGPLTGRYLPPLGGVLYFLRPGTTRLPAFERLSARLGHRRGWLEVLLYAAFLLALLAALAHPQPARAQIVPIVVLLPILGVLDKTLFLSARGEHYWTTLMVFALADDALPGAKAVQLALWFWAGVSKLNHHFPHVVGVMTSNSPLSQLPWLRKSMYRAYPDDLRPSRLAAVAGHAGTLLEFAVPVSLALGSGGELTLVGLALMLLLHGFITSNVPAGVPLEWNFMMVYGGFYLFYAHAEAHWWSLSPAVAALVVVMCVFVPLLGNLFPSRVPFLLAMRYYAGNWACSVWLFRRGSHERLNRLTKSSAWLHDQLAPLYDSSTITALLGKVMGFRLMHLHGRAIASALPLALPSPAHALEDYEWVDGELIAGMVLGWNFGDGHLHREDLLRAVQAQCAFEPGELRCIMVESQPWGRHTLHYRVHDAATGQIAEGQADVGALRELQPWDSAPV